jgi:uncharacterized protein (TIGR02679 family)
VEASPSSLPSPGSPGSSGSPGDRLGRRQLSPLLDEIARRFGEGETPVTVSLRGLPLATRRALADLLGADRLPAATGRLRLDRLAAAAGLRSIDELRAQLEELRGPLPDRRADRAAARQARAALWAWFEQEAASLSFGDPAGLSAWVAALRSGGVRGGVEQQRHRLASVLAVLGRLPAEGAPLPVLANDCIGDPHALDHGRPLAGMVLDAAAAALGWPRPTDAESARMLWEAVGVVPDPHSSTVSALGLRGGDADPLARWLSAAAGAGEPVVLSLANLRRWPVRPLPGGAALFVVENPSLLAEAVNRPGGWQGPPIVCSSGRPTIATVTLLRQLGADGATCYQHADLDPSGLAITGWLAQRAGTTPWKMDASDYRRARSPSGARVLGAIPPTPWDPALARVMAQERRAVYEEEVRSELLEAMLEIGSFGEST